MGHTFIDIKYKADMAEIVVNYNKAVAKVLAEHSPPMSYAMAAVIAKKAAWELEELRLAYERGKAGERS